MRNLLRRSPSPFKKKDQNSKTVQRDLTSIKQLLRTLWKLCSKPGIAVEGSTPWDLFDNGSSALERKFLQDIKYIGPETEDDSETDDDDGQSQDVNQSDLGTIESRRASRKRKRDEEQADDTEEDDDSTSTFQAERTSTKESAARNKRAVGPGISKSARRQPSVMFSSRTDHEEVSLLPLVAATA